MSISNNRELETLQSDASALAKLPINGLVAGFVLGDEIDGLHLRKIADAAPTIPITFHRAFEGVRSPESSIGELRASSIVDRLLIRAAGRFSLSYLADLQSIAGPQIKIITGTGLSSEALTEMAHFPPCAKFTWAGPPASPRPRKAR